MMVLVFQSSVAHEQMNEFTTLSVANRIVDIQNHMKTHHHLRLGDIANVGILIMLSVFGALMVTENIGLTSVFSPSYQADGFCVAHPTLSIHGICFAANAFLAAVMWYLAGPRAPFVLSHKAASPIKENSVSLFGHGVGHLFLALIETHGVQGDQAFEVFRSGDGEVNNMVSGFGRCIAYFVLLGVWFGFKKDDQFRSPTVALMLAFIHNTLQFFILPSKFFFVHVLMAVLGDCAISGLWFRTDKDVYYDLEAWLVDIPILLMTFTEALGCDAFLLPMGGHFWFDMVVPFGFFTYYSILVFIGERTQKSEKIN